MLEDGPMGRMCAAADIESATEDPDDLPEPSVLAPGAVPPSSALGRLQGDDR